MSRAQLYKIIMARKLNMTQIPDAQAGMIPVTLLKAEPCTVSQIKTADKDGYTAIQVKYDNKKTEFRINNHLSNEIKAGDALTIEAFQPGDTVYVVGTTKGKGFQGVVKRYGFRGASATHGTKHAHRQPGSIGSAFPQRVFKGKKMAGRMGGNKKTIRDVKVIAVDPEQNIIAVKGPVPGPRRSLIKLFGNPMIAPAKEERAKAKA